MINPLNSIGNLNTVNISAPVSNEPKEKLHVQEYSKDKVTLRTSKRSNDVAISKRLKGAFVGGTKGVLEGVKESFNHPFRVIIGGIVGGMVGSVLGTPIAQTIGVTIGLLRFPLSEGVSGTLEGFKNPAKEGIK